MYLVGKSDAWDRMIRVGWGGRRRRGGRVGGVWMANIAAKTT